MEVGGGKEKQKEGNTVAGMYERKIKFSKERKRKFVIVDSVPSL